MHPGYFQRHGWNLDVFRLPRQRLLVERVVGL
jgi:hypothetical protein